MKIGFISDIHEDTIRLKEAIDLLKIHNCDQIVCLGDMVGYSVPFYHFLKTRNGHKVIEIVKNECIISIAGNHDVACIEKLPESRDFDYPENWYTLDYFEREKLSEGKVWLYQNELPPMLTKEDKDYISGLPEFKSGNFGGLKVMLSHYAYPDLVGDTTVEHKDPDQTERHFDFIEKNNCNIGISGHDHREGMFLFTRKKSEELAFGKHSLPEETCWLNGPCVANGTFANGVMILNTSAKEIEILPLNSEKHVPPNWRNL